MKNGVTVLLLRTSSIIQLPTAIHFMIRHPVRPIPMCIIMIHKVVTGEA